MKAKSKSKGTSSFMKSESKLLNKFPLIPFFRTSKSGKVKSRITRLRKVASKRR